MNLSDMRTWLRKRTGNPTTTDVPDTDYNDILNDAYKEITDRYVFHDGRRIVTFNTVAPTATVPPQVTSRYDLPADCLAVLSLWNTGSTAAPTTQGKLTKRDESWLSSHQVDPTNPISGVPTDYVRQKGWIELVPPPDDEYLMRLTYKYSVASMVLDNDSPVIPEAWHSGIRYLARAKFYDEYRQDTEKAKWAYGVYRTWVESKPTELQEEDFADNTEGVQVPTLANTSGITRPMSSNDFDRMD